MQRKGFLNAQPQVALASLMYFLLPPPLQDLQLYPPTRFEAEHGWDIGKRLAEKFTEGTVSACPFSEVRLVRAVCDSISVSSVALFKVSSFFFCLDLTQDLLQLSIPLLEYLSKLNHLK